jgi:hypothetical protein
MPANPAATASQPDSGTRSPSSGPASATTSSGPTANTAWLPPRPRRTKLTTMMQVMAISTMARTSCSSGRRVRTAARNPPGRRSASTMTKAAKNQ